MFELWGGVISPPSLIGNFAIAAWDRRVIFADFILGGLMRDLYMIVSGKVNLRFRSADIFVSGASIDQRYDAEIFADRSYKESFEAGYYTQQEMEDLLIDKGLWSEKEDEVLEKLPDDLEQMKLDYYNNFHVLETRLKVKGYIDKTIEKIGKLLSKKNVYYENTCEGIRDTSRHDYLIERTSFYKDGGFFDFGKVSPRIVAVLYMKTCLDSNEIRQISKLDRWRATWAACKTPGELFGRTVDMTDMQLSLLSWSRVYDNVHESTEVPTEDIIEDDLALDGWFVAQRKKRENDLNESRGDKMSEKLKNAGEIFIPAGSEDDAKRIHSMNTGEGRAKSKARFNELKQRGSLEEQEFNVVKKDLAMAGTRMAAQSIKGN